MYQSDRNFVTPSNDRSLYSGLIRDANAVLKRGNQFSVSVDGLVATINTGQAIIQGSLVEISAPESLTLPANSSGNICIVVDFTKSNDINGTPGDENYQVNVNQIYMAAVTGPLQQDDLNNGGFIYDLPIASFTSSASTAAVTQINLSLNDTGWLNLNLTGGTVFNSGGYARYRIRDGWAYIELFGINCRNATNGNQLFTIPSTILSRLNNGRKIDFAGYSNQAFVGITMQPNNPTCWLDTWTDNQNVKASQSFPLDS